MWFQWIVMILVPLLLYTGNIMFLIGCSSPPLSGLALYQVDVKHLAENLELAAREDGAKSGGENFTVILPPELPTYWRVGIHGICDVYGNTGEIVCRSDFIPPQDVMTVLEECLRDHIPASSEDQANKNQHQSPESLRLANITSSWREAYRALSVDRLAKHEKMVVKFVRALVVLTIIIMIIEAWAMYRWIFCPRVEDSYEAIGWLCITGIVCIMVAGCYGALFGVTMLRVAGKHGDYVGPALAIPVVGVVFRGILVFCIMPWILISKRRRGLFNNAGATSYTALTPAEQPPDYELSQLNQPGNKTVNTAIGQTERPGSPSGYAGPSEPPPPYTPR